MEQRRNRRTGRSNRHGTREMTTDGAVVGGEITGLTAVCYLARSGAKVTFLEKALRLGGHAATR